MTEQPAGLRKTIERLQRTSKRQAEQIERLTRMLLLERLKDGEIDFSEGLDLLDHYRPEWTGADTFDTAFSLPAVEEWLSVRRTAE